VESRVKWSVAVAICLVAVAVAAGTVLWLVRSGDGRPTATPPPDPSRSVAPSTTPSPAPASVPRSCGTARHAFAPRTISIPGVTRAAAVITPPRDANGVPGVPPLTTSGKSVFAWDRAQGTRPGGRAGNVLLNAHTWPDGSALGNRMLAGLHRGDRIVVHGAGRRLCYRVTERVEVLAQRGLPRYYARHGRPQLAILACSGRRLGPGVWEKRTVWFASPSA
jgi:hypothetical protein